MESRKNNGVHQKKIIILLIWSVRSSEEINYSYFKLQHAKPLNLISTVSCFTPNPPPSTRFWTSSEFVYWSGTGNIFYKRQDRDLSTYKKNEKPIKRRFFKQKFKCLRVETQKKIYKGVGELPRTLVRHTPSSKSHFLLPRY